MNTNNESQKIMFKLNKKIYTKKSILESSEAFREICFVDFNEETYEICIKPKENCNLKELSYEFCNYCLGSIKQ